MGLWVLVRCTFRTGRFISMGVPGVVCMMLFSNEGGPPLLFAIADEDAVGRKDGLALRLLLSPPTNAVMESRVMPINVEKSKFWSTRRYMPRR